MNSVSCVTSDLQECRVIDPVEGVWCVWSVEPP